MDDPDEKIISSLPTKKALMMSNHMRHEESLPTLNSEVGMIPKLSVVVLRKKDNLIYHSDEFS